MDLIARQTKCLSIERMPKKGKESDGIKHWREWDSEEKRSKSTPGEEGCAQREKDANRERINKANFQTLLGT